MKYRGSVPYILKGRAGPRNIVRYTADFVILGFRAIELEVSLYWSKNESKGLSLLRLCFKSGYPLVFKLIPDLLRCFS